MKKKIIKKKKFFFSCLHTLFFSMLKKQQDFSYHSNIPNQSSSLYDSFLIAVAFQEESDTLARTNALRSKYHTSNAKKCVDFSLLKTLGNGVPPNSKPQFKEALNSRILRGPNPYQFNGNQVELMTLYMQLYTSWSADLFLLPGLYERAIRTVLVFFNDFDGISEQIPPFTQFFSGPNINAQNASHTIFSQPNTQYLDNAVILFDKVTPLGCGNALVVNEYDQATSVYTSLLRTNGELYLNEQFDLVNMRTTFYKDTNYDINDPSTIVESTLYKNISSGLLVLYVAADFKDNSYDPEITVRADFRIEWVDV